MNAQARKNLGAALSCQGKSDEADAEFRRAAELQGRQDVEREPKNANCHLSLADVLLHLGKMDEADAEYRKAIELDPKNPSAHTQLVAVLRQEGKMGEAVAEFRRRFAELQPGDAQARLDLLEALGDQGKLDEVVAEYRVAIERDPMNAQAHSNLGQALRFQSKTDEADAEFRRAAELRGRQDIERDPEDPNAHYSLGHALQDQGKLDEAVAEYREAIRIRRDDVASHWDLGGILEQKGRFADAFREFRLLHRDDIVNRFAPYFRAGDDRYVTRMRDCEVLARLGATLPVFLEGKAQPADAVTGINLALLCQVYKHRYAAAARFYGQAFTAEPALAEKLGAQGSRYDAACAAALAGCGQGQDADGLDEKERARLRRQALDWLAAELGAVRSLLEKGPDAKRPAIAQYLQHWQEDADLAGVRGEEALPKLSEAELPDWRKLWQDIEALRQRAAARPDGKDGPK